MAYKTIASLVAGLACAASAVQVLADDAGMAGIRDEIRALREHYEAQKREYESRLEALEKRLTEADARAAKAEQAATAAQAGAAQAATAAATAQAGAAQAASAASAAGKQTSSTAFNPAISLILNGTYSNLQHDPANYRVDGFLSSQDANNLGRTPGSRGFSLGESEMFLSSNIDPWFAGGLNLALEPDNTVSIEEAYFNTTSLGHGFTIKGGRFFSALGYQNSIHAHAWDFVDPSLVQQAFLGGNYGDDGLQVNWVSPLESALLEFGGEIGRGKDAPGTNRDKNGVGSATLYAHLGGDVGIGGSYRVGVSTLRTSTGSAGTSMADLDDRTGVTNRFSGDLALDGLDFVYKWAPNGDYAYTNFKVVGEWFRLHRNGSLAYDTTGIDSVSSFESTQSGWYLQGVYQFHPYWRVGLRYDRLDPGSMNAGANAANGVVATDYAPTRYSTMLDWSPSEFSRLRLQYSRDNSRQGFADNQWFIQYIYSLGTHGAHKF